MDAAKRPSGLRFLENLAYLVPGYQGYKRRALRQDEDARLRVRVHHQLIQMLDSLDSIRERWEAEEWGAHMDHLSQRRLRLLRGTGTYQPGKQTMHGTFTRRRFGPELVRG